MKTSIGVWIDHREAILVTLSDSGEVTRRLVSGMEKHIRFSGAAQTDTAEDIRDRRFSNHLNAYYDIVIELIHAADALLILGPGEAKGELATRLEQAAGPHAPSVSLESADKMTPGQIAARVRQHFAL